MDLGLRGKKAIVCAASQGLGYAVADELSAEGASVLICSRRKEAIEHAADKIRNAHGGEIVGIAADVSDRMQLQHIVGEAIGHFGRVDILVTNSGGPPAGTFEQLTPQDWDDAYQLLVSSTVELIRLVLPGMRERHWGRILNVTSIASKQPVENLMLSNSLRAAVSGLAKSLASEVARDGVTVNNILPGYTRTERLDELIGFLSDKDGATADDVVARWTSEIPARRLGDPREFAALAAFLVSERASYITGSSIPVDGGWTRAIF